MISDKLEIDKTWTLFLDRDGVINTLQHNDYVKTWENFEWIPGVKPSLAYLASLFKHIIVITNQQGVGKQLMTEDDLLHIHTNMVNEITKAGGRIDHVFAATSLLANDVEQMRKPGTKMLELAKEKFPTINFAKSVVIGDSESDMIMGQKMGTWTVLCNNKNEDIQADFRINSLMDCIHLFKF